MNTFTRLLSLYKKSGAEKTPLEDYCTECLAGILGSDQELLNAFVSEILRISTDESFSIFTQKSYIVDGDINRIDLVFESSSWISFLEMKVYSSEGENQLKRYRDCLLDSKINQGKETALRFCTLYINEKEELDGKEQFRWKDIAKFFHDKTEENSLINEFYQFLVEMKMAGNERFTYEDLIGLKTYGEVTAKVGEIFQLIQTELEERFGKSSRGIGTTSEIFNHDRLGLMCQDVIGDGWSEVLVAFRFGGSKVADGPILVVQLWISKSNDSFSELQEAMDNLSEYQFMEDRKGHGGAVRFEKPLVNFIESDNQFGEIRKWIVNKIDRLHTLKLKTNSLDWVDVPEGRID